jgi:hypothetical protein
MNQIGLATRQIKSGFNLLGSCRKFSDTLTMAVTASVLLPILCLSNHCWRPPAPSHPPIEVPKLHIILRHHAIERTLSPADVLLCHAFNGLVDVRIALSASPDRILITQKPVLLCNLDVRLLAVVAVVARP